MFGWEIVIIYSRNLSSVFFSYIKKFKNQPFEQKFRKENNLITSVKQKEEVKDIFKIQVFFKEVLFHSLVYHL